LHSRECPSNRLGWAGQKNDHLLALVGGRILEAKPGDGWGNTWAT
jgi:hypothetical protein